MQFDYIIIGSGSAGSTLAYRLGENKKYSIFFKHKNKDKDLFNLRRLINYQFKELGIKNIYNINKDTFTNKRVFFSHRRESQKFRDTGRMLNIIAFND